MREKNEEIMAEFKRMKILCPMSIPSSITAFPQSLAEASSFTASSNQGLMTKTSDWKNKIS